MLGGPYPPRVVPAATGSGIDVATTPFVQLVGTQWSRVAAAPPPPTGLHLTTPTPCGIPWGQLYTAGPSAPPRQQQRGQRESSIEDTTMSRRDGGRQPFASTSAAAISTATTPTPSAAGLLYRPSYFSGGGGGSYSPPAPPTGASATLTANSSALGHHYHDDETPPSAYTTTRSSPPSVLAFGAVAGRRYGQMASEHRYGTAVAAAAAAPEGPSSSASALSPRKVKAAEVVSPHGDFHDRVSKREEEQQEQQQKQQQRSAGSRGGPQHRCNTPFSNWNEGGDSGNEREGEKNCPPSSRAARRQQPLARSSGTANTATTARATSPSDAVVVSPDEQYAEEEGAEGRRGRGQRSGSGSTRSSSSSSSSSSSRRRPSSRSAQPRRAAVPCPPRPSLHTRPPPRRTRSASHAPVRGASAAAQPSAALRTAQWAVKLIDEFVAQVALQQTSSIAGPVTLPASLSPSATGRAGSRSTHHNSRISGAAAAATANTTVADLTTSFLSSRYGALQWRPMLQDFAVCLHRYHAVSPACAIFREYFIHVDVDTLSDFQLFCRLFAAADIPHCTTVEVRRVTLTQGDTAAAAAASASHRHTIVPRRYIEAREVLDRLQRMLQRVVLTGTAPCVVFGERVTHHRSSADASFVQRRGRGTSGSPLPSRYARGPPARLAAVPRRRRLTAEEVRSVKKVIVAWLEDSAEAQRLAREESDDSTEEDDDDAYEDEYGGVRRGRGHRRGTAPSLQHIAFDRPGRVDAYAFLQATLEAVKLFSSPTQTSQTPPPPEAAAEGRDSADVDTESISSVSESAYNEAAHQHQQQQRRQRQRSPRQQLEAKRRQTTVRRPSWQSAAGRTSAESPLVRRVLASPPGRCAYQVEELRDLDAHPTMHSPSRRVPSTSPPQKRGAEYHSGGDAEGKEDGEEAVPDGRAYSDGRKSSRDHHHHHRHHSNSSSRSSTTSRRREPSYQQPRAAASNIAAAVAAHRSPDGRLWSPPRDGVVPRRDARRRAPSAEKAATRRRAAHHTALHPLGRDAAGVSTPARRGYDTSMTEDVESDASPRHAAAIFSSSPRGQRTPHGRPPRSATSSPSRDPTDDEHDDGDKNGGLSHRAAGVDGRHAYVANLHAERRWQQVQRQVSAAERRDACWRQHPRIRARLQQEQQRQQQEYYGNGNRDDRAEPYGVEAPTTDANIKDIERELSRRERSHRRSPFLVAERQGSSGNSGGGGGASQNVMYLRNPMESPTVLTDAHIRLVPPPAMPPTAHIKTAGEHHHNQTGTVAISYTSAAAASGATPSPRIRVEHITPAPTPAAAPAVDSAPPSSSQLPSAGLRLAHDPPLSKETVFLTDEEQAMLDQLEVALRRLDAQHRRDRAGAAGGGGGGT